jgi:hypothetical protein
VSTLLGYPQRVQHLLAKADSHLGVPRFPLHAEDHKYLIDRTVDLRPKGWPSHLVLWRTSPGCKKSLYPCLMTKRACEAVFRWAAARTETKGFDLPVQIIKRYGPGGSFMKGSGLHPPTPQQLEASGETAPTDPADDPVDPAAAAAIAAAAAGDVMDVEDDDSDDSDEESDGESDAVESDGLEGEEV